MGRPVKLRNSINFSLAAFSDRVSIHCMSCVPLSIVIDCKRRRLPFCRSSSERVRLLGEIRRLTALRSLALYRRLN